MSRLRFSCKGIELSKKKIKPRIDWKKLTRDLDFASLLPFLLLSPVAYLSYLFIPYTQVSDALLQTILAAASFIAAVIAGFLFNAYFHLKELKLEKLARFAELQNQLKPYQEAFYRVSDQLLRRHPQIDFQLGRRVHDLHHDNKFMESDESVAIIWVHSLYDIGKQSYDTPDFEITNSILNKERLNELYDAVIQAESLLSRYKHYKYILRTLELKDTQDFDEIIIADNSFGVEYIAKTITKNAAVEDYRTLSFWELKLEECRDILERMRSNGRFIYDFVVPENHELSIYLMFITAFGILLPLFILSADIYLQRAVPYLSNLALTGFATYFTLALIRIYKRLTSNRLSIV